ncbi:uncharacterized protein BCR38DRAFT_412113 [Pseudomassariella vexata]|uniref:Uncharacterized protein n=1 Tax=Pseudomassariella vexata TaxID=1141098 RepID=A0A1Y2DP83_9PEZI|nr:uncharacterized protein BCR38DRAFT_412113 [Pseudomassariella vexata]ORY61017.1 hypothetical protein BCR38DRAFT_412113 [Pseudomassariella vexata]
MVRLRVPLHDGESYEGDPWAHLSQLYSLMRQRYLSEEEQRTMEAAITQLYSSARAEPVMLNSASCCAIRQQEVWKLVLNKEWRNAGIRVGPPTESLSVALVLGVIATGHHILETATAATHMDLSSSRQVFAEACTRITLFLLGHNSLLKLQALITLASCCMPPSAYRMEQADSFQAIVSVRSNNASAFDLISNVEACARILQAGHASLPESQLLREDAKLHNLNLAFGAAYCLEHHFDTSISLEMRELWPPLQDSTLMYQPTDMYLTSSEIAKPEV